MDIKEIVMKLNGPIYAVGESNVDAKHLENLKELTYLIDSLLFDVAELVPLSRRPEASMKAIGVWASDFLKNIHDSP